jgi:hypothetical protein
MREEFDVGVKIARLEAALVRLASYLVLYIGKAQVDELVRMLHPDMRLDDGKSIDRQRTKTCTDCSCKVRSGDSPESR